MRKRVSSQLAYVLHSYAYSESSLIIEAFSYHHGRVALLARGARRPRSATRGLLMSFQPLELGWSGKGEVFSLNKVEWLGGLPLLHGHALFCGYYLNELLVRLLPREDAHSVLFTRYAEVLEHLSCLTKRQSEEIELRRFERDLLREIGYGLILDRDGKGELIEPAAWYAYEIEQGPVRLDTKGDHSVCVKGQTLLDLYTDSFESERSRQETKLLMRSLLKHYLGNKPLQTRKIFTEHVDIGI